MRELWLRYAEGCLSHWAWVGTLWGVYCAAPLHQKLHSWPRRRRETTPCFSLTVYDWFTNSSIWHGFEIISYGVVSKLWLWHSYYFTVVDISYGQYTDPNLWHDDVIKWKHFPRYWPFVRRIHRSPVNSPHKGQWRGALMFSLICVWINGWVNNRAAGDLRRHRAHYDVTVITYMPCYCILWMTY